MSIVDTAKNAKTIRSGPPRICPICHEEYFSLFDKLYIDAYKFCYTCDPTTEESQSENIFAIINSEG